MLPFPALPVVTISAPVDIVRVPAPVVTKSTVPPAFPTLLEAVPPEVVMSPPIVILAVVFPPLGFLTAVLISTAPPAVLALPVVFIVEVEFIVKEPAPVAEPPRTAPVSLAPETVTLPPKVVRSTLLPSVTSP